MSDLPSTRVCPRCGAAKPPAQELCYACRNPPDPEIDQLRADLAAARALLADLAEELGWACDRVGGPLTPDTSSLLERARAALAPDAAPTEGS